MSSAQTPASAPQPPSGRIAVVGMAVHYAGSRDKNEFWSTLSNNEIKTGPISQERLGSKRKSLHYVNSRPKYADTFNNDKYGCVDTMDGTLDNEHDLLLKLALTALEDMQTRRETVAELNPARVGIVSGCLSFPSDRLQGELLNLYQQHLEKNLPSKTDLDVFNGDHSPWTTAQDPSTACDPKDKRFYMDPATFVADELELGGVRYSVDAACASALYVLKLAQDHLLNPDSGVDVMLCGGVCYPEPFFILTGFSTFHAMPLAKGVSMPLRKKTEGLTPGEGGSIMVLKRYEDAVRDGDKIYGSLLGCRLNNAGDGLPLTPHQASQRACLGECYEKIGLNPHMVQYVECHATGTPLGDVSECEAMRHVFEGRVPRFGSTKGNFGHTLVAAGFAGMAKVLLAMNEGVIPPTPGVDADSVVDPKVVIQKSEPWPDVSDGRLKRAGLSAFGFGGTNAHAVFEEARGGGLLLPCAAAADS
jgi:acyl transferase domain-containing protein